jgi:predicted ATPase
MLESIELKNFKAARSLVIPLKPLTVLSGLNGSGKSTVLQAIGLIRQSLLLSSSLTLPFLNLRGPLVQLGVGTDVLSDRASNNEIEIALTVNKIRKNWTAEIHGEEDILAIKETVGLPDPIEYFLRNCFFQFLQADRLTPRTHYERSDSASSDVGFLGAHGEFTPDYLAEHGDRYEVPQRRRCPSTAQGLPVGLMERIVATPKLYDQLSGWLQHLSPGVRLDARRLSQTDLVTLGFSYASTQIGEDSSRRRPSNVGFGLTYCLPIVTACLAAQQGAILLIENPEAHLHPRGQAAFGALLAKCAADGVQIIVETHSDHVLNGIRLAVKKKDIDSAEVQVCNFTRDPITGDSFIETPKVMPNGELTAWPIGFFDEWEKSLEELLG